MKSFTVVAAGDLLVHEGLTAQAAADARAAGRAGHDFGQVLAGIAPVIRAADLAVCHLEQPLAKPEGPFTGYPIFSAPPGLAAGAAEAGFDACSTASNHSLDTGADGIDRTLAALDRQGISHAGTARTAEEAQRIPMTSAQGVPVAHLSYTFSFNGIPLPEGRPWAANPIDPGRILADARRAKAAGAEVVLVSMHWGTEYQSEADPGQTGLAATLLASPDVDLIIGHHVHVVQPMARIGGKWVAYGLSNLTARFPDGSPEQTQDALAARFTFSRTGTGWAVTRAEAIPTFMEYYPAARVVNLGEAIAGPAAPAQYRRAHARIARVLTSLGAPVEIRTA